MFPNCHTLHEREHIFSSGPRYTLKFYAFPLGGHWRPNCVVACMGDVAPEHSGTGIMYIAPSIDL